MKELNQTYKLINIGFHLKYEFSKEHQNIRLIDIVLFEEYRICIYIILNKICSKK